MKNIKIVGKSVFSGRYLEIEVRDGHIDTVTEVEKNIGQDTFISPGFLDIQVNGYAGVDYSGRPEVDQIENLVRILGTNGTTRHLPTIVTNSPEQIIRSIEGIRDARKKSEIVRESIVGLHIEGPFISPREGARGVHNPEYIRPANYQEYRRWQDAADGLIKIVTVSPEDDNALDFIRTVSGDGVVVAIGHTDAEPEMIERAVDAGASLSTHLGNGSPAMIPRLKNFIWKQLGEDRLTASIIADGYHLPAEVLRSFIRGKGCDRTVLISDAAALAGSPPGLYQWNGMDVRVHDDGHLGLDQTSNLAGAAYLLNTCIGHLHVSTGVSLSDCVGCATTNPSNLIGVESWTGDPTPGQKANLIMFQKENQSLTIQLAIQNDKILYERNSGEKDDN